jgi:glycosyltransferase involved in cell wall biosynthesis
MGRAAEFFTPALKKSCHVPAVVTLSADRAGSDRFEASWPAKARAVATVLRRCAVLLAVRPPDAVYLPISQWGLPLLRDCIVVVLARAAGCTPVLHLHGAQLPPRLSASRWLRTVLAGAHWIVLSEAVAEQVRASGCRTKSVTVIRNPAPPIPAVPREALPPSPSRAFRVGWLGTRSRAKGFDVLCCAVEQLKQRGKSVEFRVAGMRRDVPESRVTCVDQDLGVLQPADVPSFWSAVDVFVLPARWTEGLPFVLLEALQAGCAVAATPSPGCAELFDHGCVDDVDSTVGSVTRFLAECTDDLEGVRRRQQKAWAELRPLYSTERVEGSFVRFWQTARLRSR